MSARTPVVTTSDILVAQIAKAGGQASVQQLERAMTRWTLPHHFRSAVFFAEIAGRIERVLLAGGEPGLRLVAREEREAA